MSMLSDHHLKDLIEREQLKVQPFDINKALNPTSINLRLGSILIKYKAQMLRLDATPEYEEIDIPWDGYLLEPGEFVLGMTKEKVSIPNGYQGFIETKGNIARAGIQIHNGDGHIEPGFTGHITLEISNMHKKDISIQLLADIYVCQLHIYTLSSKCDTPYQGRYSNHAKPTTYLPSKEDKDRLLSTVRDLTHA